MLALDDPNRNHQANVFASWFVTVVAEVLFTIGIIGGQ